MSCNAPGGRARVPAVILTGPPGSGKTTECLRIAAAARHLGMAAAGVISRPRFLGGVEVARDLLEVDSGRTRELCRRVGSGGHPLASAWDFNEEVIASGVAAIVASSKADVVIVDEIGPIELLGGGGWAVVMDLMRERRHQLWIVVVRPSLVLLFAGRLSEVEVVVFEPGSWDRDAFLSWSRTK